MPAANVYGTFSHAKLNTTDLLGTIPATSLVGLADVCGNVQHWLPSQVYDDTPAPGAQTFLSQNIPWSSIPRTAIVAAGVAVTDICGGVTSNYVQFVGQGASNYAYGLYTLSSNNTSNASVLSSNYAYGLSIQSSNYSQYIGQGASNYAYSLLSSTSNAIQTQVNLLPTYGSPYTITTPTYSSNPWYYSIFSSNNATAGSVVVNAAGTHMFVSAAGGWAGEPGFSSLNIPSTQKTWSYNTSTFPSQITQGTLSTTVYVQSNVGVWGSNVIGAITQSSLPAWLQPSLIQTGWTCNSPTIVTSNILTTNFDILGWQDSVHATNTLTTSNIITQNILYTPTYEYVLNSLVFASNLVGPPTYPAWSIPYTTYSTHIDQLFQFSSNTIPPGGLATYYNPGGVSNGVTMLEDSTYGSWVAEPFWNLLGISSNVTQWAAWFPQSPYPVTQTVSTRTLYVPDNIGIQGSNVVSPISESILPPFLQPTLVLNHFTSNLIGISSALTSTQNIDKLSWKDSTNPTSSNTVTQVWTYTSNYSVEPVYNYVLPPLLGTNITLSNNLYTSNVSSSNVSTQSLQVTGVAILTGTVAPITCTSVTATSTTEINTFYGSVIVQGGSKTNVVAPSREFQVGQSDSYDAVE